MKSKTRVKRSFNWPHDEDKRDKVVEMYIANDYAQYQARGYDAAAVFQRAKEVVNVASSTYQVLGIYVVLVGMEVWSEADKFLVNTTNVDSVLGSWYDYRKTNINPFHYNDNAVLLINKGFQSGVVGKAVIGSMCSNTISGSVVSEINRSAAAVGTTLAHELGHNLGLTHDSDSCSCVDRSGHCIMYATTNSQRPASNWSSCSKDQISNTFHQGGDLCLYDAPNALFQPNVSTCGNGILETGEDCDCGKAPKEECNSSCCNATTCRLIGSATCASGRCCDVAKCRIRKVGTECRKKSDDCDVAEFCDGILSLCPVDTYKPDGTLCTVNQDSAYCYQGRCSSHSSQCELIWGSGTNSSNARCYIRFNILGLHYGNCGLKWLPNVTYIPCQQSDVMCGKLQCEDNERTLAYYQSYYLMSTGSIGSYNCHSVIFDYGLRVQDPGLVPNGAKCGVGKMCISQKCVDVSSLTEASCTENCRPDEVCNNLGKCQKYGSQATSSDKSTTSTTPSTTKSSTTSSTISPTTSTKSTTTSTTKTTITPRTTSPIRSTTSAAWTTNSDPDQSTSSTTSTTSTTPSTTKSSTTSSTISPTTSTKSTTTSTKSTTTSTTKTTVTPRTTSPIRPTPSTDWTTNSDPDQFYSSAATTTTTPQTSTKSSTTSLTTSPTTSTKSTTTSTKSTITSTKSTTTSTAKTTVTPRTTSPIRSTTSAAWTTTSDPDQFYSSAATTTMTPETSTQSSTTYSTTSPTTSTKSTTTSTKSATTSTTKTTVTPRTSSPIRSTTSAAWTTNSDPDQSNEGAFGVHLGKSQTGVTNPLRLDGALANRLSRYIFSTNSFRSSLISVSQFLYTEICAGVLESTTAQLRTTGAYPPLSFDWMSTAQNGVDSGCRGGVLSANRIVTISISQNGGGVYSSRDQRETSWSMFSVTDTMKYDSHLLCVLGARSSSTYGALPFSSPLVNPVSPFPLYNAATTAYTCDSDATAYFFSMSVGVPAGKTATVQLVISGINYTFEMTRQNTRTNGTTTLARTVLVPCTSEARMLLVDGEVVPRSNLISFTAFPYELKTGKSLSWAAYRTGDVTNPGMITYDLWLVREGINFQVENSVVQIPISGYYYIYVSAGVGQLKPLILSVLVNNYNPLFGLTRTASDHNGIDTIGHGMVVLLSENDKLRVFAGTTAHSSSSGLHTSFIGMLLYQN